MTYFIMQKPVHRSGASLLMEFETDSEAKARERFLDYMGALLDEHPSGQYRYVNFDRWLGGWVDESTAHPIDPEDLQDSPPAWFKGPGYYDESDNRILDATDASLDRITFSDYTYYLTNLPYDGPKEWGRP